MEKSKFQFTNPVLAKVDFLINEDFNPEEEKDLQLPLEIKSSVRQLDVTSAYVSLQADIAKKSSEYPFFLSAVMGAQFQWDSQIDNTTVKEMLNNNAPALLLGYLRPWIAQITMAGQVQPLHIPFMDFTVSS